MTLYKVFNRLQAFLFFSPFFGESTRESKENTCCTLGWPIRMRTQVFLLARGSHHNVEMAQKLGKRVNDFLIIYENETSSTTRLIILVF